MCVRSKMYKHVKTCGGGQTHSDPENGVREQSFGSTHFGRSTTAKNSSEREPQPHQHASIQWIQTRYPHFTQALLPQPFTVEKIPAKLPHSLRCLETSK